MPSRPRTPTTVWTPTRVIPISKTRSSAHPGDCQVGLAGRLTRPGETDRPRDLRKTRLRVHPLFSNCPRTAPHSKVPPLLWHPAQVVVVLGNSWRSRDVLWHRSLFTTVLSNEIFWRRRRGRRILVPVQEPADLAPSLRRRTAAAVNQFTAMITTIAKRPPQSTMQPIKAQN